MSPRLSNKEFAKLRRLRFSEARKLYDDAVLSRRSEAKLVKAVRLFLALEEVVDEHGTSARTFAHPQQVGEAVEAAELALAGALLSPETGETGEELDGALRRALLDAAHTISEMGCTCVNREQGHAPDCVGVSEADRILAAAGLKDERGAP